MVDRCGQDLECVNLQVLSLPRFCVTRVVDVLDVVKENLRQVCVLCVDNQLVANEFKKKKNVGDGHSFPWTWGLLPSLITKLWHSHWNFFWIKQDAECTCMRELFE